ncbi:prepro-urotensin II-beta-like [Carassius gibelio]|uniref:prepro-urotensin II-beta-like n=1 Tax=Carassius gibelio TaxID=101364 RepID=UPI0022786359|nr:prepro-urotensin II-beta-like [Carassius gibelio]
MASDGNVLEPLLGRPLIHSAEMTYGRPGKCSHLLSFTQAKVQQVICYISCSPVVLVEEEQVVSPDDLSYSRQAYLSQGAAGFGYPSLITGDISSDGQRFISICSSLKLAVSEQLDSSRVEMQKNVQVLLEKPLSSRFLGGRKQYRKRGGNTECFWKYCV